MAPYGKKHCVFDWRNRSDHSRLHPVLGGRLLPDGRLLGLVIKAQSISTHPPQTRANESALLINRYPVASYSRRNDPSACYRCGQESVLFSPGTIASRNPIFFCSQSSVQPRVHCCKTGFWLMLGGHTLYLCALLQTHREQNPRKKPSPFNPDFFFLFRFCCHPIAALVIPETIGCGF